jgi:hypothetical protein
MRDRLSARVPLQSLTQTIATLDTRRVKPAPKQAEAIYHTPEYRAWREAVITRAGARCEAITKDGRRCRKAAPRNRMFADHRKELKDGGAPFDLANGECLCGSHHSAKTARSRAARR